MECHADRPVAGRARPSPAGADVQLPCGTGERAGADHALAVIAGGAGRTCWETKRWLAGRSALRAGEREIVYRGTRPSGLAPARRPAPGRSARAVAVILQSFIETRGDCIQGLCLCHVDESDRSEAGVGEAVSHEGVLPASGIASSNVAPPPGGIVHVWMPRMMFAGSRRRRPVEQGADHVERREQRRPAFITWSRMQLAGRRPSAALLVLVGRAVEDDEVRRGGLHAGEVAVPFRRRRPLR